MIGFRQQHPLAGKGRNISLQPLRLPQKLYDLKIGQAFRNGKMAYHRVARAKNVHCPPPAHMGGEGVFSGLKLPCGGLVTHPQDEHQSAVYDPRPGKQTGDTAKAGSRWNNHYGGFRQGARYRESVGKIEKQGEENGAKRRHGKGYAEEPPPHDQILSPLRVPDRAPKRHWCLQSQRNWKGQAAPCALWPYAARDQGHSPPRGCRD